MPGRATPRAQAQALRLRAAVSDDHADQVELLTQALADPFGALAASQRRHSAATTLR